MTEAELQGRTHLAAVMSDADLERKIAAAHEAYQATFNGPFNRSVAQIALRKLNALLAKRSPAQVAKMEREKGLV